jgi:serine/threonine-protein kinase
MSLAPGTRLGAYEIAALIGAGGMGEVYRARDGKLQRDVAIKVLPDAMARDGERLARLEREARTLAALNHPHIAQVHGFETTGTTNALVMEFVDGPTLADTIAHGPVPLEEALSIARQIAEALEAAHEQGIVHRDLKPANIKVRHDGTVKVLDFGLAKAIESTAMSSNVTMSPTITTPAMTQAGVIMGTAAYMSPEQAKGRAADKRSDVWAFGCVLFEMLTGRRAFDGEDMTDVLGAVVRLEPDWRALSPDVPLPVRTLLRRCLVKDRRNRVADIAAARFVLEHQSRGADHVAAAPQRPRWLSIAVVSAGAVLIAAAAVMGALYMRPAPAVPVVRSVIPTSGATALASSGLWRDVAITPDGRRVIYHGSDQLMMRALDSLESRVLARGAPRNAFVSPDGQWVGFFDRNTIRKVAITGGPAETVAQIQGDAGGATWGPDGTIVFATGDPTSGLMRVPADGGTPTPLTTLDRDTRDHVWPEFLPGGRALLYTIYPTAGGLDGTRVAVLDLQSGTSKVLIRVGTHAQFVPTGHLIYSAGGALRAVGFDPDRLELTGTPVTVLEGISSTRTGAAQVAVSANGTLVYVPGSAGALRTILSVDRQGRATPLPGLRPDIFRQLRVSPDGRRLAYSASGDIFVFELSRGTSTRLTTEPTTDLNPIWTRDGQRIVYTSLRAGYPEIFWRAADGTGTEERILTRGKDLTGLFGTGWSADGTQLLFTEAPPDLLSSIGQVAIDRPADVRVLLKNGFTTSKATISPNGRWMAYESNASGRFEIYVERYPELGSRRQVSINGGRDARWSADGRELYFATEDGRQILAVSMQYGASSLEPGAPRVLFEVGMTPIVAGDQSYDVSPDGRFFVIRNEGNQEEGSAPTLVLVQNWFDELRRLVPND